MTTNPADLEEEVEEKMHEITITTRENENNPLLGKPITPNLRTEEDHVTLMNSPTLYREFTKTNVNILQSGNSFVLNPNSIIYVFWIFLLCVFFVYDLIIVPYSICFGPDISFGILIIDIIRIFIYFFDIIINFNCGYMHMLFFFVIFK